jgi:hypothetical protein
MKTTNIKNKINIFVILAISFVFLFSFAKAQEDKKILSPWDNFSVKVYCGFSDILGINGDLDNCKMLLLSI